MRRTALLLAAGLVACVPARGSRTHERTETCPSGMQLVEGGSYTPVGRELVADVGSFCIDEHEVLVSDYVECVRNGECVSPKGDATWKCNVEQDDWGTHPANCLSFAMADAYCRWAGKRIPTNDEWEWVARGGERGHRHPFGDTVPAPPGSVCWSHAGTCPSGSATQDRTAHGIVDLAGNVMEWTVDGAGKPYRSGGCWFLRYDPGTAYLHVDDPIEDLWDAQMTGVRCAKSADHRR